MLLIQEWQLLWPCHVQPDSKVYGAYMGPTWGRQGPGGPHVGLMNLAIWAHWLTNYLHECTICTNLEMKFVLLPTEWINKDSYLPQICAGTLRCRLQSKHKRDFLLDGEVELSTLWARVWHHHQENIHLWNSVSSAGYYNKTAAIANTPKWLMM